MQLLWAGAWTQDQGWMTFGNSYFEHQLLDIFLFIYKICRNDITNKKNKKQVSSYSLLSLYGQIIHLKTNGRFVSQKKNRVADSLILN